LICAQSIGLAEEDDRPDRRSLSGEKITTVENGNTFGAIALSANVRPCNVSGEVFLQALERASAALDARDDLPERAKRSGLALIQHIRDRC
jgi:hypothetical protein